MPPPLWWSQYASALLFLECYIRGWADGWSRLVLAEIQQATAVPEREGGAGPSAEVWVGQWAVSLSQKQYCSGPQGGLYPAFWWSYLVSSSCCLLVIQLESHTSKPVTVPSRFLLSFDVSHTLSTRLQDKQTSQPLLTSTSVYR